MTDYRKKTDALRQRVERFNPTVILTRGARFVMLPNGEDPRDYAQHGAPILEREIDVLGKASRERKAPEATVRAIARIKNAMPGAEVVGAIEEDADD